MPAFTLPILLQVSGADLGRMLRADAQNLALGILLLGLPEPYR